MEHLAKIVRAKAIGIAKCRFVHGYDDHLGHEIVHLDLHGLTLDSDNRYRFDVCDENGVMHSSPLHRVKQVFKDGSLIWQGRH